MYLSRSNLSSSAGISSFTFMLTCHVCPLEIMMSNDILLADRLGDIENNQWLYNRSAIAADFQADLIVMVDSSPFC